MGSVGGEKRRSIVETGISVILRGIRVVEERGGDGGGRDVVVGRRRSILGVRVVTWRGTQVQSGKRLVGQIHFWLFGNHRLEGG